jgi:hypothetical protein
MVNLPTMFDGGVLTALRCCSLIGHGGVGDEGARKRYLCGDLDDLAYPDPPLFAPTQSILLRWQMMLPDGFQLGCLTFGGSKAVVDNDCRRLSGCQCEFVISQAIPRRF